MNCNKIGIVGTGNVGTHLQKAFSSNGCSAHSINSRSFEGLTGKETLLLITVKDEAIGEVAQKLAEKLNGFSGVVAHTSGSVSMAVLSSYFRNYGVFYPLQTFSKEIDIKNYRTIPVFTEGSTLQVLELLDRYAIMISDYVEQLDSSTREYLHLASVFACNFVNSMYTIAEDMLYTKKLPFSFLHSLILQTAMKAISAPPHCCQTGPAKRGDNSILEKHRHLLSQQPELKEIYNRISEYIYRRHSL